MADSLTSKECCKHEEQALAWETVFGQLRKGNEKFYLGDGTGEQLAVREIERLQRENTALRNLAENLRPGPISVALGGAEHEAPYRAAVLSQSFTPSNDPPTHQELFSAVNHFAREILRLTDAAPVACTAEPPVASRQPIPVTEIITALERESANTDTDCRWLAAVALRQMDGFEARTLMCCIDQRPSEICTTLTKTVSQQLDEAGFKRRPLESLDSDSDETSVCGGCGIPLPLKPGTAHWSGCKHSESENVGD